MAKITQAGTIAPGELESVHLYINSKHYAEKDARKILTETGGDWLIGGPIYLKDRRTGLPTGACCHLKVDGEVKCAPNYTASGGIAWNSPADWRMATLPDAQAQNYVQCVPVIIGGKPVSKPQYQPDMAYACARQAVGIKCGRIAWYASKDKLTPEQLRDRLTAYGWSDAVMLDGGGSTIFMTLDGGWCCDPNRVLYSYIVFTLKKPDKPTVPQPMDSNAVKRARVLSIAAAEIGVTESPAGSNMQKYGEWFGLNGYPWCMMFVSWVMSMAGLPLPIKTASCNELANWARYHGQLVKSGYKPGDIVFMRFSGTAIQHVGFCESVKSGALVTIEGNTGAEDDANGGQVQRRTRRLSCVVSAYRPWYNM